MEQALCQNPLIDRAMVVAEGKPYVSALLFADHECISAWCADHDCQDAKELDTHPDFMQEMHEILQQVNSHFDNWQHIKRWHIVDQALTKLATSPRP